MENISTNNSQLKKLSEPKFIVFEGADNVGKSTHVEDLGSYLESEGHKVWTTAEPTRYSIYGEMIRKKPNLSNLERTLLLLLDRTFHLEEIKSYLANGYTVICDRYYWSSFAYNALDQITLNLITDHTAENALVPDVIIYLRTSEIKLSETKADPLATVMETTSVQIDVIKRYQNLINGNSLIPLIEINGDLDFEFNASLIQTKLAHYMPLAVIASLC